MIEKTKALDCPFKPIWREDGFFKAEFPGQVIRLGKTPRESGGKLFSWSDGALNCQKMKRIDSMFYGSPFPGGNTSFSMGKCIR